MVARDDEAPAHKVATKSRARDHFQHVLGLLIDNQDQYVNLFDKRGPALKQKTKELREQLDPNCQDRYTLDMLSKRWELPMIHTTEILTCVSVIKSPWRRRSTDFCLLEREESTNRRPWLLSDESKSCTRYVHQSHRNLYI